MNSSSIRILRGPLLRELITAWLFSGMLLQSASAAAPGWWSTRGVISTQKSADDYAALNQGQLKNFARAAIEEMNAKLTGGAGSELNAMLATWRTRTGNANDYAMVTLGQLKALGKRLRSRLAEAGQVVPAVWSSTTADDDDYAAANLGQAKTVFAFAIQSSSSTVAQNSTQGTNGTANTTTTGTNTGGTTTGTGAGANAAGAGGTTTTSTTTPSNTGAPPVFDDVKVSVAHKYMEACFGFYQSGQERTNNFWGRAWYNWDGAAPFLIEPYGTTDKTASVIERFDSKPFVFPPLLSAWVNWWIPPAMCLRQHSVNSYSGSDGVYRRAVALKLDASASGQSEPGMTVVALVYQGNTPYTPIPQQRSALKARGYIYVQGAKTHWTENLNPYCKINGDSVVIDPGASSVPDKQNGYVEIEMFSYQININDTATSKDDIVRKEQKVGDKAWRQWIPCTVQLPWDSKWPQNMLGTISVSSDTKNVKFVKDNTTPPLLPRPPGDDTEGAESIDVTLDWYGRGRFWITGVTQSQQKDDTKLQIRKKGSTEVFIEQPMTVFWYDASLEVKTQNTVSSIFTEDGKRRFGLSPNNAVQFTCTASVKPTGLDTSVPQIKNWQFGMVQNVADASKFGMGNPLLIAGQAIASGDQLTVPSDVVEAYTCSQLLDTDPNFAPFLYCGLEPGAMQIGQSSFNAVGGYLGVTGHARYYAKDSPNNNLDKKIDNPIEYSASNDSSKKFKVTYSTKWTLINDTFMVWCGLVKAAEGATFPVPGIFVPLRQRNWTYTADSRSQAPQSPVADATDRHPDTAPVITPPIANNPSAYQRTIETDPESTDQILLPMP